MLLQAISFLISLKLCLKRDARVYHRVSLRNDLFGFWATGKERQHHPKPDDDDDDDEELEKKMGSEWDEDSSVMFDNHFGFGG